MEWGAKSWGMSLLCFPCHWLRIKVNFLLPSDSVSTYFIQLWWAEKGQILADNNVGEKYITVFVSWSAQLGGISLILSVFSNMIKILLLSYYNFQAWRTQFTQPWPFSSFEETNVLSLIPWLFVHQLGVGQDQSRSALCIWLIVFSLHL